MSALWDSCPDGEVYIQRTSRKVSCIQHCGKGLFLNLHSWHCAWQCSKRAFDDFLGYFGVTSWYVLSLHCLHCSCSFWVRWIKHDGLGAVYVEVKVDKCRRSLHLNFLHFNVRIKLTSSGQRQLCNRRLFGKDRDESNIRVLRLSQRHISKTK